MQKTRQIRGFTLIELSLVLVIIGLIVGGIVVGRTLIRSSQLQSVATDVQSYIRSVQSFQQKYNALPGDMANATTYWGNAGGTASDTTYNGVSLSYSTSCYASQGTGTQTCNGNGNGQIADGVMSGTYTYADEEFRVWQHLSNAGFIQGSYTGVIGSAGPIDSIPGTNIPASRLSNAGYAVAWSGVTSGNTYYFDANYGHAFGVSARNASVGAATTPVMTAAEALAIDQKSDDGLPGTGKILAPKPAMLANCATTSVSSTAAYNVSSSGNQCLLIFISGF